MTVPTTCPTDGTGNPIANVVVAGIPVQWKCRACGTSWDNPNPARTETTPEPLRLRREPDLLGGEL